jgi:ATP-dependent DNA helicase RecG
MRPALLDPLFAPLGTLPGVGPKNAKLFDRLLGRADGARVLDLLFHLPIGVLDRRARPKIRDAQPDAIATLHVRVTEHRPPAPGRKGPLRVLVEDETGDVELVFFLNNFEWVKQKLPIGATRWVSGKLELWDGHLQMVHPDKVMDEKELAKMPAVEPVYGLTEGLYPRTVQKAAQAALGKAPALPEWLDAPPGDLSFAAALKRVHAPEAPEDAEPTSPARRRLAYDELLANQLALLMVRARMRVIAGRAQISEGRLAARVLGALPFSPTGAQARAMAEIRADLAAEKRMIRLLQGDVGSGKTLVALVAMAHAVEAGRQAAMMAPTEILARQHFERLGPLAEAAGLRLELFTGRDTPAQRRVKLAKLAAGEIDIAVGTHALFQESVVFRDLGLAVVDEQHRFGVHQRLALSGKGDAADLLVMTATPIPRSLVLTYFGDMDVSVLDEKPPGRAPIDTRVLPQERLDEVIAGIGRALAAGARAYWVCPLIEESEESDLAAAEARPRRCRQCSAPPSASSTAA